MSLSVVRTNTLLPVLRWSIVSRAIGKVGGERDLGRGETTIGRRRRALAATRNYDELTERLPEFPVSAIEYAAWSNMARRKVISHAMMALDSPEETKFTVKYFESVLMRQGASEALFFHASRQLQTPVALWQKFFVSLMYRRGDGDYVGAVEGLEEAGMEPNPLVYSTFIAEAHRRKDDEDVESLIERMLELKLQPTSSDLTFAVGSFMRLKKAERAKKMFSMIVRPDTLATTLLIKGLTDGGELEEAVEVWEDTRREGRVPMDLGLYTAGVNALMATKRFEEAAAVFDETLAIDELFGAPKLTLLGMRALARTGDAASTLALFRRIQQYRQPLLSAHFQCLIHAFMAGGQVKRALFYLDRMEEMKVPASPKLYQTLMRWLLKHERYQKVLDMRQKMHEARVPGTPFVAILYERAKQVLTDRGVPYVRADIPSEAGGRMVIPPPNPQERWRYRKRHRRKKAAKKVS